MRPHDLSNDGELGLARFRRRPRLQRREVVDDRPLVVVFCPAERGGVVRPILDGRVGAELDEELDQFEVAVEGGLVQRAQPLDVVDVEAEVGQQSHGVEASELGGAISCGLRATAWVRSAGSEARRSSTAGRSARMQAARKASTASSLVSAPAAASELAISLLPLSAAN